MWCDHCNTSHDGRCPRISSMLRCPSCKSEKIVVRRSDLTKTMEYACQNCWHLWGEPKPMKTAEDIAAEVYNAAFNPLMARQDPDDPNLTHLERDGVSLMSTSHPIDPASLEDIEIDLEVTRAPGVKLDSGKPDMWYHLFDNFPHALEEIALHAEEGDAEEGHVHHGWRSVPDGYKRYSAALIRHLIGEAKEKDQDEWGRKVIHARAVAWNALARLQLLLMQDVTYHKPQVESGVPGEGVISSADRDRG